MATAAAGDEKSSVNGITSESQTKNLTDLPAELLEHILCLPVLHDIDICNVSCCCKRLHDVCHEVGTVWANQFKLRWPRMRRSYQPNESCDWLREYKTRHQTGLEIRKSIESISKTFFKEVPCVGRILGESCAEIESLGMPEHFCEDELMFLNTDKRKNLTLKYYAKKILLFMRQKNIMKRFKAFLEQPAEQQSALEGALLVDQYCNPLVFVTLSDILAQLDEIVEEVKKALKIKNPSHPSLRPKKGDCSPVEDIELQGQVLSCLNTVLYEQLEYTGNEGDYYSPLNSYIHEVLLHRTGIPISLCILYMALAQKLGVRVEPVNFPNHFLLRWCQKPQGSRDIFDFVYIDAYGDGRQMTVRECGYLIGQHVMAGYYGAISTSDVLLRLVGNLLNIGKRGDGNERSYQLLRDSLDLYLTINPTNVQYLLLQARLYFHLGIWPEKVLETLQRIQAVDPSQRGAVGYLVQHTLDHIHHKKPPVTPEVKKRSALDHVVIRYSIGLVMRHKRSGYNCVIYGWDPKCTMNQDWIFTMRVNMLAGGSRQPFYNVLVHDGTCRYAAQENLEPHPSPIEIDHLEVGRYFSDFNDTHYVANEELQSRYPEDMDVTLGTVQQIYHKAKPDSGNQDHQNSHRPQPTQKQKQGST